MNIADLIALIRDDAITDKSGVEVLRTMLDACMGEDPEACEMPADIVTRLGLTKTAGDDCTDVIREVIAANPDAVADYRAGKKGAVNFLVGQVMKMTRGRADPKVINTAMDAALKEAED
jgi:aspartyl-tRNA(Asn)/glutamyl-tRNA(Gln) amidotransferase subunit B